MQNNPKCCKTEAKWVENVPGKGYYFCDTCRKEVTKHEDTSDDRDEQVWLELAGYAGHGTVLHCGDSACPYCNPNPGSQVVSYTFHTSPMSEEEAQLANDPTLSEFLKKLP